MFLLAETTGESSELAALVDTGILELI